MKKTVIYIIAAVTVAVVAIAVGGCNNEEIIDSGGKVNTFLGEFDVVYVYCVSVDGGRQGAGAGNYKCYSAGDTVHITANAPDGSRFKNWTTSSDGVTFADSSRDTTTFTMPQNYVEVKANYEKVYYVTVSGGSGATGEGFYAKGDTVHITAGKATTENQRFKGWESTGTTFADAGSDTTSFAMPSHDVTVRANFKTVNKVTVTGGNVARGDGYYEVGDTVYITADTAQQSGSKRFHNWTTLNYYDVTFFDITTPSTAFKMPNTSSGEVTVKAVFWDTFIDEREGKATTYGMVTIGNQTWMAQNLNYNTTDGSWCYGNNENNCNKYGRLYNWETAQNVCPGGWHLSSNAEWGELLDSVGGYSNAGFRLKSTVGWKASTYGLEAIDYYGFSALPGGIMYDGLFSNPEEVGAWWTSKESDAKTAAHTFSSFYSSSNVTEFDNEQKDHGLSVRCVKDNP